MPLDRRQSTNAQTPAAAAARHLHGSHARLVLLTEPQVKQEELQHVEGLFLVQMQQQQSSDEAQALAVAHLQETNARFRRAPTKKQKKQRRENQRSVWSG